MPMRPIANPAPLVTRVENPAVESIRKAAKRSKTSSGRWQLLNAIVDRGQELSDSEFRVLIYLFRNSKQGYARESYRQIAGGCSLQRRSVIRIVQRLVEAGWLSARGGGGGNRRSYLVQVPPALKKP